MITQCNKQMKKKSRKAHLLTKLGEPIMNKLKGFLLSAFLIAGISSVAQAEPGKNLKKPFVKVNPFESVTAEGCMTIPDSVLAQWTYEADTEPKFGGDAFLSADVTFDTVDGPVIEPKMIEFEIVIDPEDTEEREDGKMYYRCVDNLCTGTLVLTEVIIDNAVAEQYLNSLSYENVQLYGVYVKALNSGAGNGRQNYELTPINVCADYIEVYPEPEPEPEEEPEEEY